MENLQPQFSSDCIVPKCMILFSIFSELSQNPIIMSNAVGKSVISTPKMLYYFIQILISISALFLNTIVIHILQGNMHCNHEKKLSFKFETI